MELKKGDLVRVKKPSDIGEYPTWMFQMDIFDGRELVVLDVEENFVHLEGANAPFQEQPYWHFSPKWLTKIDIIVDKEDLKLLNTQTDSEFCAKCHGKLKDPGFGPTYKHCPKCEP